MEIFHKFRYKSRHPDTPSTFLIGFFDGVHSGHQKVFKLLKNDSSSSHIITFKQHPKNIIHPREPIVKLINTPLQKITLIEKYANPDYLYVLNFSKHLSHMTYVQFFSWIRKFIRFNTLILGYDSRFGKNREGCFASLLTLSQKLSFNIKRVSPLLIDNQIVSSTKIRHFISQGNLHMASQYLGRTYSIAGKVMKGFLYSTQNLKMPTANLNTKDLQLPPQGIYAVTVKYKELLFQGIGILEFNRIFSNEPNPELSIHIFRFDNNIYDEDIEIFFLNFLRKEKYFFSLEQLQQQRNSDVLICKKFFSEN